MRRALIPLLVMLAAPALADSNLPPAALANTQLKDPAKEAKARELMYTLRCLVCQGQSIADSDAEMAGRSSTHPCPRAGPWIPGGGGMVGPAPGASRLPRTPFHGSSCFDQASCWPGSAPSAFAMSRTAERVRYVMTLATWAA